MNSGAVAAVLGATSTLSAADSCSYSVSRDVCKPTWLTTAPISKRYVMSERLVNGAWFPSNRKGESNTHSFLIERLYALRDSSLGSGPWFRNCAAACGLANTRLPMNGLFTRTITSDRTRAPSGPQRSRNALARFSTTALPAVPPGLLLFVIVRRRTRS